MVKKADDLVVVTVNGWEMELPVKDAMIIRLLSDIATALRRRNG